MTTSNIKALVPGELCKVWELVLDIENYGAWRSGLSKTEIINEKKFVEYTKIGYRTTFTVTHVEPYRRWEFDMQNSNMTGLWIGIFTDKAVPSERIILTHRNHFTALLQRGKSHRPACWKPN